MSKEWAWSFSKIKNYETCEYRYQQVDVLKNYTDAGGAALTWGTNVHNTFAKALKTKAPLPEEMRTYQPWIDRVLAGPGDLLIEQKYAIRKDFTPTAYFANDVWYRGIGDVVRIDDIVALVLDWKTGRIKEDSVQLALMAQCIFSHFPKVLRVRSEFVWLQEDTSTPEIFDRPDMAQLWMGLLPRVNALKTAHDTNTFHPKPSRLCREHCPVKNCIHHGKSFR